ncbi:Flp pilus assembly protein CpaB [Desulfotomaculum arcticum]|uniref:Flp pilus assembly protein CpaB n=1 Tax=Desulfotruncus arcticus DSM 17038 TaxID=1121424 RepID=A0A1I2Z8V7_9FIRM|nr:SAF domain-containing protein [Desulfotruncus arcticus]SFH34293.1 Flp pilus assembly protein CpaB [Desulfotomaculum arcticum] [Desulfotruncus arcticus DSM 17038]
MNLIKKYMHIILAIILAAAAGYGVLYMINLNAPTVPVTTAREKLPIGTVITNQNIKIEKYPKIAVPDDAVFDKNQVIGKTVFEGPVLQDDIIRLQHVKDNTGSLVALLNTLAPGREAVDLPSGTATGLSGVAVGDKVDIYGEVDFIDQGKAATTTTKVAQGAIILKVPGGNKDASGPVDVEGAYVVAIQPKEAENVNNGIVKGKKFSITLLSPEVKK